MKIIPFPSKAAKKSNLRLDPKPTKTNQLITGPWSFTCTSCDSELEFQTTSIIFKRVEFFCHHCGHSHIVTNPAFGEKSENRNKK